MSDKLPYYKRYPRDYLSDENVAMMTLEEEGAYNRLMEYCWIQESIPSDLSRLARLCRVSQEKMEELWPALEPCFETLDDGRLTHPRLSKEREKALNRKRKLSRAGKKGRQKQLQQADSGATPGPPPGNGTGHPRASSEAESDTEEEDKPPIVPLWEIWVDEVWGGDTKRRLTSKRRKKLRLVWDEHLEGHDDPVGFFRKMVQAMLADDWWGPKPSTHLPEKAMRNEERREEWAVAARNGKTQPSEAERRKKHGGISYVSRGDML